MVLAAQPAQASASKRVTATKGPKPQSWSDADQDLGKGAERFTFDLPKA